LNTTLLAELDDELEREELLLEAELPELDEVPLLDDALLTLPPEPLDAEEVALAEDDPDLEFEAEEVALAEDPDLELPALLDALDVALLLLEVIVAAQFPLKQLQKSSVISTSTITSTSSEKSIKAISTIKTIYTLST